MTKGKTKASKALITKLNPARFDHISGKMSAIVGFILGEQFTTPYLVSLSITSDGFVIARPHDSGAYGGLGHEEFIGSAEDLRRNLAVLVHAAGLTRDEIMELNRLYTVKTDDWESFLGYV